MQSQQRKNGRSDFTYSFFIRNESKLSDSALPETTQININKIQVWKSTTEKGSK